MDVLANLVDVLFEWNLCILMFFVYSVIITLSGTVIHFSKKIPVPDVFLQAFKFGKMAHRASPSRLISFIEVPKRWFLHFYLTASVIVTAALWQMWSIYVAGNPLSMWMDVSLDILTAPTRKSSVSATAAAIALLLLAIHIYRRLYENLFVSVFSSGRMNILHYIVGHTHYIGAVALLVSEAPGFNFRDIDIDFSSLQRHHLTGFLLYLLGSGMQHHSLQLLAGLRKNAKKGTKKEHKMPVGGMFEILSCPHMFAEICVYLGILFILHWPVGWLLVTLWVAFNQTQVALMNHSWYLETFKDYPRERKAIIPYLL